MQQRTPKPNRKHIATNLLKIFAALVLLCAVPLVNFTVDPSRLYHQSRADSLEIKAVDYLLEGHNVANLSNYNERLLRREYLLRMNYTPSVLVAGSSRGALITTEMLGLEKGEMFNVSVANGDLRDTIGFLGLLRQLDRMPEKLVLCLDPWTVNDNWGDNRYAEALGDGYYAYVHDRLGREADATISTVGGIYNPASDNRFSFSSLSSEDRLNLFSIPYFQSSLQRYFSDDYETYRTVVPTEETSGATGVVRYDGSYAYPQDYADADAYVATERARASVPQIIGLDDYPTLKGEKYALLCAVLAALAEDGVEVQLVLCPISNYLYDYMVEHRADYANFFHTEQMYYDLAEEYGLTITGTFDPYTLRYDMNDFYDGYHLRPERVAEIVAGLETGTSMATTATASAANVEDAAENPAG